MIRRRKFSSSELFGRNGVDTRIPDTAHVLHAIRHGDMQAEKQRPLLLAFTLATPPCIKTASVSAIRDEKSLPIGTADEEGERRGGSGATARHGMTSGRGKRKDGGGKEIPFRFGRRGVRRRRGRDKLPAWQVLEKRAGKRNGDRHRRTQAPLTGCPPAVLREAQKESLAIPPGMCLGPGRKGIFVVGARRV